MTTKSQREPVRDRSPLPDNNVTTALFRNDKTKDGYVLVENTLFDGRGFTPEIVDILVPGLQIIEGDTMRNRAKRLNACLGQHFAEYLLKNQERIPKDLRGEHRLVFPGTVWQDSEGDSFVPCLRWDWKGSTWDLILSPLDREWDSKDLLIRAA